MQSISEHNNIMAINNLKEAFLYSRVAVSTSKCKMRRVMQDADLHLFPLTSFKPTCDLKQNGTPKRHNLLAQFFCPFSWCDSFCSHSFCNHPIQSSHGLMEEFCPEICLWSLYTGNKTDHTTQMLGHKKTMQENGAFSGVSFCQRSPVRV